MKDISIRRAVESDRRGLAKLTSEVFYEDFAIMNKNPEVIAQTLYDGFVIERFFVAESQGEIVGMASFSDKNSRTVYLTKKGMIKHLGLARGLVLFFLMDEDLHRPFDKGDNRANIEYVGVAKKARGCRLATRIVARVMEDTPYDIYQLDVKDNNPAAIKTYGSLGFEEFDRKKMTNPKFAGFDELIYMVKDTRDE